MKWLRRCIESVCRSSLPLDLFVVDNCSTDNTVQYLRDLADQKIITKLVESETNSGFGAANNIGINYAVANGYDYVYLLNQDAYLYEDTIAKLIDIHKRHPEYGVLSPFQIQGNDLHLDEQFANYVCSYDSNPQLINDIYYGRLDEVYSVPLVMAAHWLISIECLKQVGAFSPTFPHYAEDDNYDDRVIYHGMKVGICPGARAIHDREDVVWSKTKIEYIHYTMMLRHLSNINMHYGNGNLLWYAIKCCIEGRSFLPAKYYFRVLKRYSTIKANRKRSLLPGAFLDSTPPQFKMLIYCLLQPHKLSSLRFQAPYSALAA
jgi:GT2 family glycosyltransferase